MQTAFISIVSVIQNSAEVGRLGQFLENTATFLKATFSDFEIILINNRQAVYEIAPVIKSLSPEIKKHIHLIHLSTQFNKNHAIMAGLDRANGDYTVIFEPDFGNEPQWIEKMYLESQRGFDIVYLKALKKDASFLTGFLRSLFYFILKNYSDLKVDPLAHDTRLISRRALNSLLRLRENLRYMKAIYSVVGYKTTFLETGKALGSNGQEKFSERFRTSLVAISSFTTFLRTLSLWVFLLSGLFVVLVIFNAVKVKLTKVDIFGTHHETLSGWAFLVVIIAIFFSITFFNLYILSVYLSNIYAEIKQRPLYIIESIERF